MNRLRDRLKKKFILPSRPLAPGPSASTIGDQANDPDPAASSTMLLGLDEACVLPSVQVPDALALGSLSYTHHGAESHPDQTAWDGLKTFARVLRTSGELFGPLKSAIDMLADCVHAFEALAKTHKEYQSLQVGLNGLFHDLAGRFGDYIPPGMRASILNLARGLDREIQFVRLQEQQMKSTTYNKALFDVDQLVQCYHRIQNLLGRLSLNANVSIWMLVDEQATRYRLDKLCPSHAAWYSSQESKAIYRDQCTPNTRLEALERFKVWREDETAERIYWLNGMAGTGKTTLSYTMCKQLEGEHRLAGNFFCSRLLPTCRNVQMILPTLAYQVANYLYPFRYALSQVLEQHPDVHTRRIEEQFRLLLLTPLREVLPSIPNDLIIVIEALDECTRPSDVEEILGLLFHYMHELPIKFFLTSRPEPAIREQMLLREGERERFELHLHDLDQSIVHADIERYLRVGLKRANISAENMEILIQRSGVLFIYAATVVRYIGEFNFARCSSRLKQVLGAYAISNSSEAGINELYTLILAQAINDPRLDTSEQRDIMRVLHTVICAKEPLTAHTIAEILDVDEEGSIYAALTPLRSVLNVQSIGEGITSLHKSFSDFLFDSSRSHVFHCDMAEYNLTMAERCFELISIPNPPFNICNLALNAVFDWDIDNLDELIEERIPGSLIYACRYWSAHVELAEKTDHLVESVHAFFATRLLLWIEILNFTGYLRASGIDQLNRIATWVMASKYDQTPLTKMREVAIDAYDFTSTFCSSLLSGGTVYVYISTLPRWPTQRPISTLYHELLQKTMPTALSQRAENQLTMSLVTYAIDPPIHALSISPDGFKGVSGDADGAIYRWDMHTRRIIDSPMDGHKSSVWSVCYAPDDNRFASGSADGTVQIWDALSGRPVNQPLKGHKEDVLSISYSPDGTRIISGSRDGTVRIWDAFSGKLIGTPLEGQSGAVMSVDYSPRGNRIVSGATDGTIYIWDASNGTICRKLQGGSVETVWSVCFSPDGNHISSGSGMDLCEYGMPWAAIQSENPFGGIKKMFCLSNTRLTVLVSLLGLKTVLSEFGALLVATYLKGLFGVIRALYGQ